MPNMFDMIRQAHALKEKMAEFQKSLEGQSFTGTAGEGAVSVTLNGKHEVQKVVIQPDILKTIDAEKLQNFIQAAVNDAGQKVNEKLKAEVSKVTGGLGLPGIF